MNVIIKRRVIDMTTSGIRGPGNRSAYELRQAFYTARNTQLAAAR